MANTVFLSSTEQLSSAPQLMEQAPVFLSMGSETFCQAPALSHLTIRSDDPIGWSDRIIRSYLVLGTLAGTGLTASNYWRAL